MTKRKKSKPLRYFFYQGKLHKKIQISRANDTIVAFRYSDGAVKQYLYSEVRAHGKKAFTSSEVSKMLNRSYTSISKAIESGAVERPEMTYGLDENRHPFKYMYSEDNIMDLHDYFVNVHRGRPRKDNLITAAANLPTARELRAMIRTGRVMGYQDEDGNFIPTWQAESI